jgi:mannobiose 2-epimerase
MDYYLERLQLELKKTLDFWNNNLIASDQAEIYFECDYFGVPDKNALMGSMYLSRIIYGASSACRFLGNNNYKSLADIAFKMLYEQFRNPAGGFYWAKTRSSELVHDSGNINMAQAFILYSLSEYSLLTRNPIVEAELKKQYQFLQSTIKDGQNGGYLDGFNADWKQENLFTKSLGTHLHLLEAYLNNYKCTGERILVEQIIELIDILYERFIDKNSFECYHQLTPTWDKLPNTNWAGHNAEVSWILHHAAQTIEYSGRLQDIKELSVQMTRKVLEQAFDKKYGGVFNVLKDGKPAEKTKDWWVQAEVAVACFNAYQISKDKSFLSYGLRLVEYIENTITDATHGEWYSIVSRDGRPLQNSPKVHFWKSLYHNIRYFIQISNKIKEVSNVYSLT